MSAENHFDVIIIGTGAGGGTLLHRLAATGKKILVLERGDYVPREKDNWDSRAVNVDAKYNTKETWFDGAGKPLHPHTNYYVGGNTKFYGAALFRFREQDFGELRHHGGVSPAWPISYDDLEPYYTQAERLYHVHGTRGEDPTEPRASAPYSHPAVRHEPRIQHLADDFARLGTRPFHVPLGDSPQRAGARTRASASGARRATAIRAWSRPRPTPTRSAWSRRSSGPNVSLLTNAYVSRLETSASGREVSAVHVQRNGASETYTADIVVVSAGAINSAALLLRSANDKHPRGLANSSDVVGRHYMGHVNSVLLAVSKCPNPTIFQKTLGLNDFYFASKDWEFPMGHISFVGKLDGVALSAGAPAIAPGLHPRPDGQALPGLLAHVRGPARSGQPGHPRQERQHRPGLQAQQRGGPQAAPGQAREPA